MKTIKNIGSFFKTNFIFTVAIVAAIISCFFVPIDSGYLNYFDIDTLACITLLLLVIAGFTNIEFFQKVARWLVKKFKNTRSVIMCLIFITYVSALVNANDMSLITFLPLAYIVLKYTNNIRYVPFTFIMQNIASNLGGMITPIGNPQNLYIFSFYDMGILEFFKIMAIPTLIALILIIVVCMFVKKEPLQYEDSEAVNFSVPKAIIYGILFVITILVVLGVIPWWIATIIIVVTMAICDIKAYLHVDYTIPLTFVAFFIFSGNLSRIPAVINLMQSFINDYTFITAYISCQFISNVPTAVLLSKFTINYPHLLVSVNVASLGIIFSSLSGVIALKEYIKVVKKEKLSRKRGAWYYIGMDTLFNVVGAIILVPLSYLSLLLIGY
ncbi:MAG: citrate transporter [Clostridiales bacterium]|nr:citrate transporter [Clostridiales bacterium]